MVSYKYANRGTALYQMELLASSVFEHALKSEREEALEPKREFDDIMEALSGASRAAYTGLVSHPGLVQYFQAASPIEEISLLNIGSRPTRRFGAKSLGRPSRHSLGLRLGAEPPHHTGWYGVGQRLHSLTRSAASRARRSCPACSTSSRLFRLIIDEVEKTLLLVDLDIARDYASLVEDEGVREMIFSMIEQEYKLTSEMVLNVSGGAEIAERFPEYRRALASRLPAVNAVSRMQVELLRRFRGAERGSRPRRLQIRLAFIHQHRCRRSRRHRLNPERESDMSFTDPAGDPAPQPLRARRARLQSRAVREGGQAAPTSCSSTSRTRWRPTRRSGAQERHPGHQRDRLGHQDPVGAHQRPRHPLHVPRRGRRAGAGPRLDMIMIPKAASPPDVYAVDMLVTQVEPAKNRKKRIGFELIIETALGMANVQAIAKARSAWRRCISASPTTPPRRARAPPASAARNPITPC